MRLAAPVRLPPRVRALIRARARARSIPVADARSGCVLPSGAPSSWNELERVTSSGGRWAAELDAWASAPDGLLALTILLAQIPRNVHRGRAAMYAHDGLGLHVATLAIDAYERTPLPLVRRMFLYVPLMHVEDRTVQHAMVARFEELARRAETASPRNAGFFGSVLGSARRHADVIDRYGRFPHRNEILGRDSTDAELAYLAEPDAGF